MSTSITQLCTSDRNAVAPEKLWPYYVLFFFSGFPALLYQIVWQRALFTIYGVNIESVTIIVTVFMLGLGLGSLAGGRLSRTPRVSPLLAFGAIETAIGVFGACSLTIFEHVGRLTAGRSTATTGLMAFALLLVPTMLMGSTLPLLVEHLVRQTQNVGKSVGALYSVNTFGSAAASFAAAYLLMRSLGESNTVRFACALNLIVGTAAIARSLYRADDHPVTRVYGEQAATTARFRMCVVLAGVVGFVALAYEIMWYRLYSFATRGTAPCFPILLAYYLAGVAYGSLAVRDACAKRLSHDTQQTLWSTAKVVLLGTVCAYLTGPLLARSVTLVPVTFTVVLVFMSAALLGSALPLLAHASIEPDQPAGTGISYLYLSNIVGSTLGSFLVGFVILDHWSTQRTCALLLVVGACAFLALAGLAKPARSRLTVAAGCIVCAALAVSSKPLYSHMYERLLTKQGYERGFEFGDLVENRSGIVAVTKDSTVFGGGMYDGRFNIDPMDDRNGIFRAYAVANLKPNATEVLLIGLSSGSWAQVLVNNPSVRHMTIVEINPGYMPLIEKHAEVRSLLRNPKVEIVTDDGRRWLTAHRGRMFDLIVMNTTFHWRANVSNLLSIEFLQMLRQHMKPGGVAFYNTTDGERVLATGIAAFPYAMRVSNFLAVSDRPFALNKHGFQKTLTEYEIDGRHVFDQSREKDRSKLSELVAIFDQPDSANGVYESRSAMLTRLSGVRAITDDNMGSEWDLDSH